MDPDDVDQLVVEIMVDRRALRRKSWPLFSLYNPRVLDRLILKHFPDTDLADMPVPFYAASANLSAGEPHIHNLGNLQVAVRANWTFPGLLPPFVDEEGQMLIDGSSISPPPIQPMHRLNAGPNVVARAAMPPFGKSPVRYRDLPAWQKQVSRRLPWQKPPEGPGLPVIRECLDRRPQPDRRRAELARPPRYAARRTHSARHRCAGVARAQPFEGPDLSMGIERAGETRRGR